MLFSLRIAQGLMALHWSLVLESCGGHKNSWPAGFRSNQLTSTTSAVLNDN